MPLPAAAIPALISGGSSIVGSAVDSIFQGGQNRKSRKFALNMYDKQYKDSIDFWNMQNEYNDPQNQMKRLRDAGLNPNLVYGQGTTANTAGPLKTPDTMGAQFRAPQMGQGIASAVSRYFDTEIKQAQIDNIKADTTTKFEQAALTEANRKRSEFDLGFESDLADYSAEYRRESVRKLKQDMDLALNEDVRRSMKNDQDIRESVVRIMNMHVTRSKDKMEAQRIRAATQDIWKNVELKKLDIELRQMGINPNHPMWAQIAGRFALDLLGNTGLKKRIDSAMETKGNLGSKIMYGLFGPKK